MQDLLPKMEKKDDLQLHFSRHHHVQMSVVDYYHWKSLVLFEPSEVHWDECGMVGVLNQDGVTDFVAIAYEAAADDEKVETVEIRDVFEETLTMEENS